MVLIGILYNTLIITFKRGNNEKKYKYKSNYALF